MAQRRPQRLALYNVDDITSAATIVGGGGTTSGNRARLMSNASQLDPDTISSLENAGYLEAPPKMKRTASGTNLQASSAGKSLRSNRYSFGDGSNPSDAAYYLPRSSSYSNSTSSGNTTSTSSSIGEDPRVLTHRENSISTSRRSVHELESVKLKNILENRASAIKKSPGRSMESIIKKPFNRGGDGPATNYMTMICNFIIIGGREDAGNRADLLNKGVTHILNCAVQVPNYYEDDFIYGNIAIFDDEKTEIKPHVDQILKFLSEVEDQRGRCLVHCVSGVSRSVTAVIIYFMHRHKICLRHAFDYIKSCRPFICPNEGFKVKLACMENELFGYSTVSKKAGKVWEFYSWNEIKNSFTYKNPEHIDDDSKNTSTTCLIS